MLSIIIPNLDVDIANAITEIIISRWAKKFKKTLPAFEFWRAEYAEKADPKLKERYVLELTQVKKLLKVFSADVVLREIKDNQLETLRYLNIEQQKHLIYELFKAQYKHLDSFTGLKKSDLEKVDDKIVFLENKKQHPLIGKGL